MKRLSEAGERRRTEPYLVIGLGVVVDFIKSKNAETMQSFVRGHLERRQIQAEKAASKSSL